MSNKILAAQQEYERDFDAARKALSDLDGNLSVRGAFEAARWLQGLLERGAIDFQKVADGPGSWETPVAVERAIIQTLRQTRGEY